MSPSAFAQTATSVNADSEADELQEIVVTARRVEERLQDVPISITVFNQEQLRDHNVDNGADLARFTPSLSANSDLGSDTTNFSIRGFTQDLGTTPSVAVYFADVVVPRGAGTVPLGNGAGPGSFFDLQNVQVLKGSQGTLFGRNTTGGAILLVPQKPTSDFEGYIEGSVGDYGMKGIQGVINIPFGDFARFRLGVDSSERDGYVHNVSGVGPSSFDAVDYTSIRASLVLDLTQNIENYTIATYSHSETAGDLQKLIACAPPPLGSLFCAQLAALKASGQGFYAAQNDVPDPTSEINQWQVINTTTWAATDALTLKNIVSYAQLKDVKRDDFFGTDTFLAPGVPLAFTDYLGNSDLPATHESTFTEELQAQGRALDGRLNYQAGAYLEISQPIGTVGSTTVVDAACADAFTLKCTDVFGGFLGILVGNVADVSNRQSYHDIGVYSQATYSFTDKLKMTAGARYTDDRSNSDVEYATYFFPAPNTPFGLCTNPVPGAPVPITSLGSCFQRLEERSHAPTWLIDLEYNPIKDLMVYGKYTRGYRQGSVYPTAAAGFQTYDPEKVDTYELGSKWSFTGPIRGTLDVAAFYSDFSDQQLAVLFSGPNVSPIPGIVNAGKSRIYGAEVESSIIPFTGFRLDVGYGYLKSRLQSIATPTLAAGGLYTGTSLSTRVGDALPLTPGNKVSVTGSYTLPLPDSIGHVSAGATYTYTAREFEDEISPVNSYLPATRLVDMNLKWTNVWGKPFDLSFFVTNVTNQKYYTYVTEYYSLAGFDGALLGPPLMFGGRLRYHFGH